MFPSAGDEIYYNEAGEPIGWGKPASPEDYYCPDCGYSHMGICAGDDDYWDDDEDEEDEDDGATSERGSATSESHQP